jgi:hypothetical protein
MIMCNCLRFVHLFLFRQIRFYLVIFYQLTNLIIAMIAILAGNEVRIVRQWLIVVIVLN